MLPTSPQSDYSERANRREESAMSVPPSDASTILVIIGRGFAVPGLRSIATQQGVTIGASPLGKSKTISQVVAIALLIMGDELGGYIMVANWALWAVMLFALVSGVDYFLKFSRAVLRPGT